MSDRDDIAEFAIGVAMREQDCSDSGTRRFIWMVERLIKAITRLDTRTTTAREELK